MKIWRLNQCHERMIPSDNAITWRGAMASSTNVIGRVFNDDGLGQAT